MFRTRPASIAFLALALGLTACASEAPVVLGGGYESCNPSIGQRVTFGDVAQVSLGAAVVMESIELIDPEGLALRESYLVPIENRTSLGTDAYPPAPEFWDRRVDVRGAAVGPGTDMTALFVVEPVGDGAVHRSNGYTARYWVDGRPFVATSSARFVVAADCSADDDEG